MNKKLVIIAIIVLIIAIFISYFTLSTYHSNIDIDDFNTTDVNITAADGGLFIDGPGNDTLLIFYPGANVEYTSYLPLLSNISHNGV